MRPARGFFDSHLVLIGPMGAGKTATGLLVAQQLRRPFVDSDSMLELHFGKTACEIVATEGPEALRQADFEVFRQVMANPATVVFAGAASLMNHAEDIGRCDRAWAVWLDAPQATLDERIGSHHKPTARRALQDSGGNDDQRRQSVAEVVRLRIDSSQATPQQAAEQIATAWRAWRARNERNGIAGHSRHLPQQRVGQPA